MKKLMLLLAVVILAAQLAVAQSALKPSDVAGVWEGTLHYFGQDSRLVYVMGVNQDGTLSVSHHSPDYGLNDIPVASASVEGNRLVIKIGLYEAVFEGTVGKNFVRGRYGTPGMWIPLTLKRRSTDPRFLLDNLVPRLGKNGERVLDYRYKPPEEGDDAWPVADAHAEGVDTSKIQALMRRVLAGDFPNLHSVVVVKDGRILLDEYFHGFHRDKPHRMASTSKIIPEALIGISIARGLIDSLHVPVARLFPEYGDLLGTGEKSAITLYHLVTMTTGLRWNEHAVTYFDTLNDLSILNRSPDPIRSLFDRPLAYRPGERFVYNSGCIRALEALLQKITKAHFLVAAQRDLFTPLGISNIKWDYSDGLFMMPRDMAKLGWLFLQGGEFNGSRILPAAWTDSAMQRFEREYPRYFNHWWPFVFFVDGVPIKAFQAGGWGGQSITIVPTLNTVIVQTAGSQLRQVDYDVCIRDYLLPAILTPDYMAKHPGTEYSSLARTKGLEWEMRWNTEMGCMKACAKALGLTINDTQLYGGTGVGFLINVDAKAEAKSMAVWNWRGASDLCPNLGFSVESIWSHKSSKEFSATQRLVWDRVRKTIDSGYACYGFHLDNPIRSLVIGYDQIGYYYKGWEAERGKGPVYWYDLGKTDIGLLGMHFVRPVSSKVPYREMVKKAFQFVIEFSANSPKWVPGDCKAGPEGYERWITLLESGKEDSYGASYNAAELAEGRGFALKFLEEAKTRIGPEFVSLLDEAIEYYRRVAAEAASLARVFPHTVSASQREANLKNPDRRRAAIRHLRAAKEAEVEGLKALTSVVERLEVP
jgi:CubicO group peptidase (beta-lactamase class C family)